MVCLIQVCKDFKEYNLQSFDDCFNPLDEPVLTSVHEMIEMKSISVQLM